MDAECVKKSKPKKHHVTFKLDELAPSNETDTETKMTAVNTAKLKTPWVFWYDMHTPSSDERSLDEFLQKIHKVCEFSTFPDFWSSWQEVYRLCPLSMNSSIRICIILQSNSLK